MPATRERSKDAGEAPEVIEAEVDRLIARRRAKDAIDVAKRLRGRVPSAAADAAIVRAYRARIAELVDRGLAREAEELSQQVAERFSGAREALRDVSVRAEVGAAPEAGIAPLADPRLDSARRRAIEEALRRDLSDPRWLARTTALPEGHPLKAAARAVAAALEAATSRPLGPEELRGLEAIGRRSPLAPWRALVEAIAALHRGDRPALEAALAAVPEDTRPFRAVPAIRRAAGLPETAEQGPAEASLLASLAGGRTALRARLGRLEELARPRTAREAVSEARAILAALRSTEPRLARSLEEALARLFFERRVPLVDFDRAVGREVGDPELSRLQALALERVDPLNAIDVFEVFIEDSLGHGKFGRKSEAAARVLLRMAALEPSRGDRRRLLERAREAWPTAATRAPLVKLLTELDPKAAEREALAWHEAAPLDLEPLLVLIRAAEGRGSVRKALRHLEAAEAIDRLSPEVRGARFRLLLEGAEGRVREGKYRAARRDLTALEGVAEAGAGRRIYVRALEMLCACKEEGLEAAPSGERASALAEGFLSEAPDRLFGCFVAATAANAVRARIPSALGVGADSIEGAAPRVLAAAVGSVVALGRDLGRPFSVPLIVAERLEAALRSGRDVDAIEAQDLLAVARFALACRPARHGLAFAASRAGLARPGGLLHLFLLERGAGLRALGDVDTRSALEAALALARERRDADAIERALRELDWAREAGLVTPYDAEEDGPVDREAVLRRERSRPRPPSPTPTRRAGRERPRPTAPPERRPAPDRYARDLFDLLDGIEKETL